MFFILTLSEKKEKGFSKLVVSFVIITGDFNFVSSVVTPTGWNLSTTPSSSIVQSESTSPTALSTCA